jgi:hypothetical protein
MTARPADDTIDADLSRRALNLMNTLDLRLASTVSEPCCVLRAACDPDIDCLIEL